MTISKKNKKDPLKHFIQQIMIIKGNVTFGKPQTFRPYNTTKKII